MAQGKMKKKVCLWRIHHLSLFLDFDAQRCEAKGQENQEAKHRTKEGHSNDFAGKESIGC
jgi:hypothetical protein